MHYIEINVVMLMSGYNKLMHTFKMSHSKQICAFLYQNVVIINISLLCYIHVLTWLCLQN